VKATLSKAEKTKEYIIERSAPLFNKKGYAGTSLSDIMEVTALTKGSIYGNFENKDELAVAVYKHSFYSLRKRIAQDVMIQEKAIDKLLAITLYYRNNWKQVCERGGCPMLNASVEADDHLSYLKKPVQDSIKLFVKDMVYIIELGQKNKEFKRKIDPTEYAYTIITILEGAVMLLKTMNNQQLLFSALDRIDAIIHHEIKK
jgi:TetR/AcrR family transcriptional repressor of nem operon